MNVKSSKNLFILVVAGSALLLMCINAKWSTMALNLLFLIGERN